ncbi:hypothetical protein [Candidatus Pelagibacter sp. HIMB1521]|uniref:hypothetical protein n=1 Tax=Candidatus Pelagibacter sp. HIMB1521 TaxID=3413344 RepID=UPI003F86D9CD
MTVNLPLKIIFIIFILFGFYLCKVGGYGSDEDTLPMIGTYIGYLNGNFMTSRFTGYPVAEFIIGFLSFNFGSFATNIFIFLSLISGLVIYYLSLKNEINTNNLILFLIFVLSNPIIFFDNLEPIDYSIAFLFFSLGMYYLKRNFFELSVIFFGICIGARINFAPFVIITILFAKTDFIANNYRKVFIILSSIFIGCLFYLPVWIQSSLTLDWLRAGRPDGDFLEYFVRFFYKTWKTIGFIQLFVFIYLLRKYLKPVLNYKYSILNFLLIFSNLVIFLYIPAELSYLQPMIIFLYFIIYECAEKKYIYSLIVINFLTWFVNFEPIKVSYKSNNYCDPVQALDASIEPKIIKGYYFNFLETRDKIKCWIDLDTDYGKKILEGKPLK